MSCDCNTLVIGEAGPQGPQGLQGINGTVGRDGVNAFTTLIDPFTQPAVGASVTFFVAENSWIAIGQSLFIASAGTYTVISTATSPVNSVTATLISTSGVASGATVPALAKVTPTAVATFSGTISSLAVVTGGSSNLDGPVVINGSGNNSDFRVEGTGYEHLFFCDANAGGSGRVGIATATPETILHVFGNFKVGTGIAPADCELTGDLSVGKDFSVNTSSFVVDATNNRVGIASANPTVALDVDGAIKAVGNISGGAGTFTGGLTVDTNTLVVDAANGRVGIGTTTPTVALDVVGAGKFSGDLTVDTDTLVVDATNNRVGIGTTTPTVALDVVGAVKATGAVSGASAAITGNLTVDTNTLVVDATNNSVGIGSSTPTVALDVVGAVKATGAVSGTLGTFTGAVSGTSGTFTGAVSGTSGTFSGNLTVDTTTLAVDATANRVGIGSGTPTTTLDVAGEAKFNSAIIVGALSVDSPTLVVDATNNRVGIGSSSPTVTLDVDGVGKFSAGVSGTTGTFTGAVSGTSGAFTGAVSGTTGTFTGAISGASAAITGNLIVDTNTLVVDATNNRVGIGTTTPTVALDVVGAGKFSGAVSGTDGTFTGGLTVDTNTLVVDAANGRVGIAKAVPTVALDVTGAISSTGAISGTAGTFSGVVSGTTGTFTGAVSGTSGAFTGAVSGTTGTFTGDLTVDTDVLKVNTTSNRVGINSGTPGAVLDVVGDFRASNSAWIGSSGTATSLYAALSGSSPRVGIGKTTNATYALEVVGDIFASTDITGSTIISKGSTNGFNWNVGASTYFIATQTSNIARVGINSATPGFNLDVVGNAKFTTGLTAGTFPTLFVRPTATTGAPGGQVGIGTDTFSTSPFNPALEVNGSIKAVDLTLSGSFDATSFIVNPGGVANSKIFQVLGSSNTVFPITVKGVTSGGIVNAVGIYNSDPTLPLDITGDVRIVGGRLRRVIATTSGTTYDLASTPFASSLVITTAGSTTVTLTLPAATSTNLGQEMRIKTTVYTGQVKSSVVNIINLSGTSTDVILPSPAAGKWATLVCDGNNWQIMAASA